MRRRFAVIRLVLFAAVVAPVSFTRAAAPTVVVPPSGEKAYAIAGETFGELWEKVTGTRPAVKKTEASLPAGDVVLIGSDAVQPVTHELIRDGALEGLGLVYGGDGYCIRSVPRDGRQIVIVAGGSGRSTLYAVYDFFRRQAGAEYFWDGDVIPRHDTIALAGIDVQEEPRFEYRGLRYFAHRGLHRFQAEHWDLVDWQREIDWLVKKRFNLWMLRTGIDDLFQRAFPDVPYPPTDGPDPDAQPRLYNDRTSFWALKYRGELRKQVLQYARDRGLVHPEDTGTITHWYSHTPSAFYRTRPDFPVLGDEKSGYTLATQKVWDIEDDEAWDAYWKLTETHIREFGQPRMFHTIGLAERKYGKTARENLQRKLFCYRKIQQRLREHYPDAPLLVASWDFNWWKNEDVARLLDELDPRRTIILDYLADCPSKKSYRDGGMFGRFPWIFGIFASFACNSDIHEDYAILAPRLREAAGDRQCVGLVTWPEISHNDTFLLEYLADNSWQPERLELSEATPRYCKTRYPAELASPMESLWDAFFPLSQTFHWDNSWRCWDPQYRVLTSRFLNTLTAKQLKSLDADYARMLPVLKGSPKVLQGLAGLSEKWYEDPLWRRDAIDMGRTTAGRALYFAMVLGAQRMEAWRNGKADADQVRRMAELSQDVLGTLSDIVAQSDDFSMEASLRRLGDAKEINGVAPTVNPHAEQTLKGNAENDYCRSQHYELVEHVYRPELAAYWAWVLKRIESDDRAEWRRPDEFAGQEKVIVDRFYETPLAQMAPTGPRSAKQLAGALSRLESLIETLVDESAK